MTHLVSFSSSALSAMAVLFKVFFAVISVFCLFLLFRAILFKSGLIFVIKRWWRPAEDFFHVYQFLKIPEFSPETAQENLLYRKVVSYLSRLSSTEDSDFTNLFAANKANDIVLGLDPNQIIEDNFLGARVFWIHQERCLVLKIRKSDKRRILRPYLQHILNDLENQKRELRLHINDNKRWRSIPFTHPSTFETIAMEDDLKSRVKSDLDSFLKAKQYYHRLGRVWKRSFLLYGPSGTGKSSFVAAMANYIGFDIYDVDLSKVSDDGDLKNLLLQTKGKSIILIEDLDRILADKPEKLSFSGILNIMDGILNSCCAEEKVLVFTMNSKENVDPAFLRPGRVDVHIHFPLCDFSSFKILANNYLGVKDHKLFPHVEEIFQNGASLSPAEVGELMIANRSSPSRAIKSVISALHTDGEGRGRLSDPGSRKSGEEVNEQEPVFCREPMTKELRKLYGLIRLRSNRKSQSFDMSSLP